MRFALVNEVRTEPYPGLAGICGCCGRAMIPKCGRYVRWHWAHKRRSSCDPWHETETDWHLMWKDCFPPHCQERVLVDERTGERHVADVKVDNGRVVEIQHSPIAEGEMRSREDFYGDMIWIVDARDVFGYFTLGMSHDLATCDPMSYYLEWIGRSTLLNRWAEARKPVYFDILFQNSSTPKVQTPSAQHLLWRLFDFKPEDGRGFIAPVRSDWLVQAVLDGDSLPLMRCEKKDAWRHRRTMVSCRLTERGLVPIR